MLGKQAKILSKQQIYGVLQYLRTTHLPERNEVIFLLSLKAGLRAKEIAELRWSMLTDADGTISNVIAVTDEVSKGKSGAYIPMASDLRLSLMRLINTQSPHCLNSRIVQTVRAGDTSSQVIINLFRSWYMKLGFFGCSSHSGRRTFITNAAKNIGRFGGSLRDVQALARHQSLLMTQRYIEVDTDAMRKVVNI